ncbi:MAG: hypothetical protein H0U66_13000 [Gemmatimonadaceae bacterium]|nr:hypothetical protein [Gemmatimonadaceae bacterium]
MTAGDTCPFPNARRASSRNRHAFWKSGSKPNSWWSLSTISAGASLRRHFASERKDESISDIAALDGWKSTATLLTCYIEADADTMKRALERRRVLSEERMESTNGEQHRASE